VRPIVRLLSLLPPRMRALDTDGMHTPPDVTSPASLAAAGR